MGVIELDFQSVIQYKGSCSSYFDLMNKKSKAGDVYTCADTDTIYVCIDGTNWDEIYSYASPKFPDFGELKEPKEIKTTVCPHCGAPIDVGRVRKDGTCTCDFCGSFIYIY